MIFHRKCKPSRVLSRDRTRPLLMAAWVRLAGGKPGDHDELIATDSYTFARIPLTDGHGLKAGPISPTVLKLLEQGREHVALDDGSIQVFDDNGRITYAPPAHADGGKLPPYVTNPDSMMPDISNGQVAVTIGLNADLLKNLADAIGAPGGSVALRVNVDRQTFQPSLRAYLVTATRDRDEPGGPVGLLMPVRTDV